MSFFISDAAAQAQGASPQGGFGSLIMMVLIFVIMYFMLIRPQQKKMKEHKQMVDALAKGDEIVTSGGILGKIVALDETFASLEVADSVVIRVQRGAVGNVLPKGTLKSIK